METRLVSLLNGGCFLKEGGFGFGFFFGWVTSKLLLDRRVGLGHLG